MSPPWSTCTSARSACIRDLAPLGGIPLPTCYWCSSEAPSGGFGILLADVGHLGRDDQRLGISGPRLETAVAGLAEQHARWWESAALGKLGWLPPFDAPWQHVVYEKYPRAVARVLRALRGRASRRGRSVSGARSPMRCTELPASWSTGPPLWPTVTTGPTTCSSKVARSGSWPSTGN